MNPVVKISFTEEADLSVALPSYETSGAAGADIRANLPEQSREAGLVLAPSERASVPTGLRMEIPEGFEIQVRPRSGLALKHGIALVNAPGTIDSDYRGPVGIILINHGQKPFAIAHGDRIAQIVVAPVTQASFAPSVALATSERGTGGFGSTGRQ